MLDRLLCGLGRHTPDAETIEWRNSSSGSGFDVTCCRVCGIELTRRPASKWRAIALKDR